MIIPSRGPLATSWAIMPTDARNNAVKTRGRPFAAGNPGRPKGARHKATLAAEALLDGEAEALTRKAIDAALGGDVTALRLCLERLVPARKERPVTFALPPIANATDHPAALEAIMTGVAVGDLTPGEAHAFAGILKEHRAAIETAEFAARLDALEARITPNGE